MVNYWATWCDSCIKEIPDLSTLHEQNKSENIIVVGINNEKLKGFVSAYEIPYPVWRSKELEITPLGPVLALPTTYIIDPEGNVVAGEAGVITQKKLQDYINKKMKLAKYAKYSNKKSG